MIQVRLLGSFDVRDASGRTVGAVHQQPKRAALLAYLAAAPGNDFRRRDEIVALFWPEADEQHARNSLSAALRFLRRALGERTITARGSEELGLEPAAVWSDVLAFHGALAEGDLPQALQLYRGDLLAGFHVSGAPAFEEWLQTERARIRARAVLAARELADSAAGRGDLTVAAHWARVALEIVPDEETTLRRFIIALDRIGDRAGALRAYEAFATRLAEEYGAEPAPETVELIGTVRERSTTNGAVVTKTPAATPAGGTGEIGGTGDIGGTTPRSRQGGEPAFDPVSTERIPPDERQTVPAARRRRSPRRARWIVAAVIGIGAMAAALVPRSSQRDARTMTILEFNSVKALEISLPDSAPLAYIGSAPLGIGRRALAISPGGTRLVYVARSGATTMLHVRELGRIDVQPLPGSEGAYEPFFSPTGEWVGFFAEGKLKKVSVLSGHVATLGPVVEPYGAAWASDGRILIAEQQGHRLSWMPATGGSPQPVGLPIRSRVYQPEFLPGDTWILHGSTDGALSLTSPTTGEQLVFTRGGLRPRGSAPFAELLYGKNPRFVSSGHVTYISGDGVVMAVPFDDARVEMLGPPEPVLSGIRVEGWESGAQYTVSHGGTLVYARGADARVSAFVWVDHSTGRVDTVPVPEASYEGFDLSPDDRRIIARVQPSSGPAELVVLDLERGDRTRVPTLGVPNLRPRWWPGGSLVQFGEWREGATISDGVTVLQSIHGLDSRDTLVLGVVPAEPTPDGKRLAIPSGDSWMVVPLDRLPAAPPGDFAVLFPSFSPDGRWLAYTSIGEEHSEVFVVPTERPTERYKVSAMGGEEATWTPDGEHLVYRNGQEWHRVDVSTSEGRVVVSRPTVLFRGPYAQVWGWSSDMSSDGRRHLLLLGPAEQVTDQLVVVTNWFSELRRLAPDRRRGRDLPITWQERN